VPEQHKSPLELKGLEELIFEGQDAYLGVSKLLKRHLEIRSIELLNPVS
jgi:hypothetical protein